MCSATVKRDLVGACIYPQCPCFHRPWNILTGNFLMFWLPLQMFEYDGSITEELCNVILLIGVLLPHSQQLLIMNDVVGQISLA